MLTRPQVILLAGLLLLFTAAALTYIGRRGRSGQPLFQRRRCRLRMTRRPLSMLRQCLYLRAEAPELTVLHALGQQLTEELLRLRRAVRALPALPGEHEPRLMALARQIAAEESVTPAVMEQMLRAWQADSVTGDERLALPVCTAAAQCEMLCMTLHALLQDAQDRQKATRLAAQLTRSKRPMELLTRNPMSLTALAALLSHLRTQQQDMLLELIGHWLAGHGTDAGTLAERSAARQTAIADDLQNAAERLRLMALLDWHETAEACDPLHELMLQDPADVYTQMNRTARQQYRARAEMLSEWFHAGPETIVNSALRLCQQAERSSLEAHIGWYLWEKAGIKALQQELSLRRGRYRLLFLSHRDLVLRSFLWIFSILCAILYLNAGEPLLLLPVFLSVAGVFPRAALMRTVKPLTPSGMEVTAVTEELRTLVILPAILRDAQDALRALRFLRSASCAFPSDGVDLMLLADHAPAITRTVSGDQAIIAAAAQGTAALCEETGSQHFLYLHRARCWLPNQHTFGARSGCTGAAEMICRLAAQGECADFFDYASFSPASLHRRYSFVLVLHEAETPVPGLLEKLLSAASHPLHTRWPEGMRGWSCFAPAVPGNAEHIRSQTRLIRPDAFLEAVDGALPEGYQDERRLISDALSGTAVVSGAAVHASASAAPHRHMKAAYQNVSDHLQTIRWMLPWSHVIGLSGKGIPSRNRFILREELRWCLLPICRVILLGWSLLDRNALLMLAALFLPAAGMLLHRRPHQPFQSLKDVVQLPSTAAAAAAAVWQAFTAAIRHDKPAPCLSCSWQSLELSAQGIAVLACLAASAVLPFWLPALLPAACFGLSPLLHHYDARNLLAYNPLPTDREPALRQIAESTWRCLSGSLSPADAALPPICVQTSPAVPVCPQTSPELAGMYMLSLVCAKELGFLEPQEAARRICAVHEALARLPLRHGLPCRRYSLPELIPADETINARSCGLLLVSLMTCAQALRSWLPALPAELQELPAALDGYAETLDILRLYDTSARLFYLSLDENGQGVGHAVYFSDVALLLSVAARARSLIPPEHLFALSRTCAEASGDRLPLSCSGDLTAYLLPGLFFPTDEATARQVILLHQKHGSHGMWGRAEAAANAFTPDLQYRRHIFGLREIAADEPSCASVFTPYAAALALPFAPEAALDCLINMQKTPLWGQQGFFDSIDQSQDPPQVAFTQDTCHQALILCAAAHVLADAPLRRYFAELPAVQACLPLLEQQNVTPLHLPPRPVRPATSSAQRVRERTADASHVPMDACLIGSKAASILMNALGSSRMICDGVPLTRFTGSVMELEGMQVYLSIRGRVYRAADPLLPGKLTFVGDKIRSERLCGCLRICMTLWADPASAQILHLIEVTNLSTADCRFDIADLLPAGLSASRESLEAVRPTRQKLILHDRASGKRMYHQASFSQPPAALCVCTDMISFTERGRGLEAPASLEEPMCDLHAPACADCLSFRAAFMLSGRAQLQLLFTTGMTDAPLPVWHELPGLMRIAEMHACAVSESIPIPPAERDAAERMAGALFWQGLPHQGAHAPLSTAATEALSLFSPPLMTITMPDEASIPRLREILRAAAWYHLHGQGFTLYILCTAETEEAARAAIHTALLDETSCHLLVNASPEMTEALFAVSSLVFRGDDRSLSAQLEALERPIPALGKGTLPSPGLLPDLSLQNDGGYGGFDPESGDYIIRLEARQTTPMPWKQWLYSQHFSFAANESRLLLPAAQHLSISLDGGMSFNPLQAGLPMLIRIGHGWMRWRVYARDFVLTLDVACLHGHPAAIHALRIRNTGREARTIGIAATADLAASPLTHLQAIGDVVFASGRPSSYLAACSDGWTADTPDTYVLPSAHAGSKAARLSSQLLIEAGVSASAVWILGHADSTDEAAAAQAAVRTTGASVCIRAAREASGNALPSLTISTPEPTLDLLVNHVLPRQVQSAGHICQICTITDPEKSRIQLLLEAAAAPSDLLVAMRTALYLVLTGDAAVLEQTVRDGMTLHSICREGILSCQPEGNTASSPRQLCEGMLAASAADVLLSCTDDEALAAHRQTLLHVAAALWHTDHHSPDGLPLLSIQACTALALGDTPRVHRGLHTCWGSLYDRQHGLIREKQPDGSSPCPGTPANGGQLTASAILFLAALIRLGHTGQAWELLRALNPLHHTDDPVRSEEYAGPPWLLPEGMHAAPSAPGRAVGEDAASANLLLTLIVTQFLGLSLKRGQLTMEPSAPSDWDSFSLTMRLGTSTWHISMERDLTDSTCDGLPMSGSAAITDDGRIHQIRLPLNQKGSSV